MVLERLGRMDMALVSGQPGAEGKKTKTEVDNVSDTKKSPRHHWHMCPAPWVPHLLDAVFRITLCSEPSSRCLSGTNAPRLLCFVLVCTAYICQACSPIRSIWREGGIERCEYKDPRDRGYRCASTSAQDGSSSQSWSAAVWVLF
ncbi:hypothetical protein TgHK011_008588 [Trichoderma gracile]|nr:hypothetical protein TgHK011_008588 [Trichoderma gracile]